ncbi:MAG TPA: terephthalate dihydrodiol dehydrogenase [Pusillimonas sp.]|jgi:4-hydroxy-L-threonine phosphate dehydrogenase PdxA|nr:terephthalate dihydrodiol dehydrogenase [Pusillimonas sp.]|tara:strand:+ start:148758 stop:149777 length:1020 start_codon:yes stop_codon:yes gene_type:complete
MNPCIAIAIGDPNGIGPEIAVKAALSLQGRGAQPVLVGDAHVISHYLAQSEADCELLDFDQWWGNGVASASRASPNGQTPAGKSVLYAPVSALPANDFVPGKVSAAAGQATVAYVSKAVELAQQGRVQAVIGCPHSETAINQAGIAFSGYPGLIARLTETPADEVFLMLVAGGLRIAHVTLHESVQTALNRMTPALFENAAVAAIEATQHLGLETPRLAVMGINPHAGEGGLFGQDDQRVTVPVVQRLVDRGYAASGPLGADVLLAQRRHDVYLAPFHDQGHIPVKLLSPLRASALTIGTPVRFSSVGHGSAHDIAGKGVADPASVIETFALLGANNHA